MHSVAKVAEHSSEISSTVGEVMAQVAARRAARIPAVSFRFTHEAEWLNSAYTAEEWQRDRDISARLWWQYRIMSDIVVWQPEYFRADAGNFILTSDQFH